MNAYTYPPVHVLKAHLGPFAATWAGQKLHEVRVNDRGFCTGDLVELREYDHEADRFTGRGISARILYVSAGGAYGLPSGLCVFSLLVLECRRA